MNHGNKWLVGFLLVSALNMYASARTIGLSSSVSYQGTAAGSGRTFSVTSDIQWWAWSNDDWITVVGGYPTVTGNGTVTYGFTSNAGQPARNGTITVAGGGVERTFTVHQLATPEQLTLSSYERRVNRRSHSYLRVDVESNVDWTVTSHNSWITIEGSASGSGNGFVSYSVKSSPDLSYVRSGSFSVSGGGITRRFYVYQDAALDSDGYTTPSFLNLNKTTEAVQYFGAVTLSVSSDMDWTATPNHAWITVSGLRDGNDSWKFVDLYLQPNRGNQPRVGSVTVRGLGRSATFTITQAPMPYIYILPPKSKQHYADTTDMQVWSFTVRANTDWCASVSYSAPLPKTGQWIELVGFTGSGDGQQQYVISGNPYDARNAKINVSNTGVSYAENDRFEIDQYKGYLVIFPEDRYHPRTASVGTEIDVTATVSWQATADQSWITIMAGASGSGDGTIRYDVSQNYSFGYRTGTITVTGGGGFSRTYSIVQGGTQPSELSLSQTERDHNHEHKSGWTISVRANVPWKASAPWWIGFRSGSGTGNGTIEYYVIENTAGRRSGNIIVTGGGLTREFAVSQAEHPSRLEIPGEWLRRHGLPEDGSRNQDDITGKGAKVYQDWIADTDPNDFKDRFVFYTALQDSGGVTVHWQGRAGRKYMFYRMNNPGAANWGDPFYTVSCHDDGPMSYRIPQGASNSRYYRIGVKIE